jgi:serine/threonine protein phosphatase PrpC
MGCDGIFDKLTNKEVIDLVWNNINKKFENIQNNSIENKPEENKITLDTH